MLLYAIWHYNNSAGLPLKIFFNQYVQFELFIVEYCTVHTETWELWYKS
jgi:hypothetical protein